MSVYKKINIGLLTLTVATTMGVYLFWSNKCFGSCSINLIDTWLFPVYFGGKYLTVILGILVVFSASIFKRWLQYILWWAVPLSLKLVYDISAHTGGIMSVSKADMAESLGQIFIIVTAIFIAAYYLIAWWKKRKGNPVAAS